MYNNIVVVNGPYKAETSANFLYPCFSGKQ